jgi:hypothetical protein
MYEYFKDSRKNTNWINARHVHEHILEYQNLETYKNEAYEFYNLLKLDFLKFSYYKHLIKDCGQTIFDHDINTCFISSYKNILNFSQ